MDKRVAGRSPLSRSLPDDSNYSAFVKALSGLYSVVARVAGL